MQSESIKVTHWVTLYGTHLIRPCFRVIFKPFSLKPDPNDRHVLTPIMLSKTLALKINTEMALENRWNWCENTLEWSGKYVF
ncbi:hypothetical protein Bhyg_05929 [Pseudolycoriella hygida]|uniref:Uncharacterized protein n=1 Tax=Pseudolycoriella hygida TaxID=35572 RepID=A0A9Q0N0J1_9DIPT|nr:hypothetical protein Bhyg_05929 [Pseudolycoriella hygida]